ncbi:trypco2 family protein [Kitasatospora sp. NPDC058444]|uniref:trypco2 family protein n=1 Tax=Kitasatospora sp. NPDC058444 TaxID=3346504 RepID=UPI003668FAD9
MADSFTEPTLAESIAQIRRELEEALEEGKDQAVRFGVGAVELEFLIEARSVAGGDVGVRFHVVSLGGKAERQRGQTNRVTVTLQPIGQDGKPLKVARPLAHRPRQQGKEQSEAKPSNAAAQKAHRP